MSVRGLALTVSLGLFLSCSSSPRPQTFATPDEAVQALIAAVKDPGTEKLLAIFGPEAQELVDSGDPGAGRLARRVFRVAIAEGWRLESQGSDRVLVIGNEDWPFPIPLAQEGNRWHFDIAKGREEVLNRRIGRNELAAIRVVRTYVVAQRLYARRGHDGKRAGLYAAVFRSDQGRQNGLYWPAGRGEPRSPLGDLVAGAADDLGRPASGQSKPAPFHGYYFRILTAQGPAAKGGEQNYMVGGELAGGFALVAWPAQYGVTGITTFIVNHEGVPHEKDLGPGTDAAARAMTHYNADQSWAVVE